MTRLRGRNARIAARATAKLFQHFQNQHMEVADHFKVSRQKVAEWMLRGYVSTMAALMSDELRIPGACKHELRPDVISWDRIRDAHLAMARAQNAEAYPDL